jgi:hypothetical protein
MAYSNPRDPAKPVEYYEQFVAAKRSDMEFLREASDQATDPRRKAGLIATFPQKANDIAIALYSEGAIVSECKRWLGTAVDARKQIAELRSFRFEEYGLANEDLRTFSGACLVDRQAEMVEMQRNSTFETNPVPGLIDLIEQYCGVLAGEHVLRKVDERSLKKVAPQWLTLPPLFQSVAERDHRLFAERLETYLSTTWERYAKVVKRAINDPAPIYFGTWNLVSAALCKIMNSVPELSSKTRGYVPVELLGE